MAEGPGRRPATAEAANASSQPVLGLRPIQGRSPSHPGVEPREGSILNLQGIGTGGRVPEPRPATGRSSWGGRPREKDSSQPGRRSKPSRPPSGQQRGFGLYVLAGGVLALGVGAIVWALAAPTPARPPIASVDAAPPASPSDAAPAEASAVAQLTALIHRIGAESDELHALIETQGRMIADCRVDSSKCDRGWTRRSFEAMTPIDIAVVASSSRSALIPPPGMKVPRDFPFRNDPMVTGVYSYHSSNIDGRQVFDAMLRECSQYAEVFDSTLRKYGAPAWLAAVVYQESQCRSDVRSPVGALGLWQFMPESARAYSLQVVEDEVDERLNPIKATDAAIHMLVDLQRKFGAWELALAAYNMGPFGLTERLAQVWSKTGDTGAPAGFWDLVGHELLPRETAGYVPRIEAYALLIENRTKLGFPPDGKPLASTAEVVVGSGTRLSLIARAARTSTRVIRELNPEFLRDTVPTGVRAARVPPSEVHSAQVFLDDPPTDTHDRCVPEDFDWGRQVFEKSPYARNCSRDH
jgi:membrane-bound lytic murein transglycosylase D